MNKYIELTESEMLKIKDYAKRFLKHKEGKSKKQGSKSDLYYDIQGFTGEYIVHKHFHIPFRWEFDDNIRYDDITLLYEGRPLICDIKSSKTASELIIPKWQMEEDKGYFRGTDVYILVKVSEDFSGGTIEGIVSKGKFRKFAKLKKYNTECYCLSKKHLKPIGWLKGSIYNLLYS